jgi:nucleoid-associated protein YgaU
MTNSVAGSVTLPTSVTSPAVGVQQPDGLPLVAGGGSQVAGSLPATTSAQTPTAGSVVDRALAGVLGTTDVVGGGADAPSSDPRAGIPAFVRQFLADGSATPSSPAVEGVDQQAPSKSGPGQVQQGWAWIGCAPSAPSRPTMPPPIYQQPPADQVPPGKGELPPPVDQVPPGKGEPPSKAPPVEAPGKVDQSSGDRGTHTVGTGEYLSVIAPKYGLTWKQLYWANRDQIKHPDLIHPGQKLIIPPCDLEVPDFAYEPMFTGKPGKVTPGTHNPPAKGEAPGKDTPPPGVEHPAPPRPSDQPSNRPPGSPNPDDELPLAPPVPILGDLPPALPG